MKHKTGFNYLQKIEGVLPPEEFFLVEKDLVTGMNAQLEALWHLVNYGYSVEFSVRNYRNLFEYVRRNSLEYSDALEIFYSVCPGVISGIGIKELEFFELN